jgi:integrase
MRDRAQSADLPGCLSPAALYRPGRRFLRKATKDNRYGHRDATMILVAYRQGLRAAELVDLRWARVEFRTATLHVRRVKQGTPTGSSRTRICYAMLVATRLRIKDTTRGPCKPTSGIATSSTRCATPSYRRRDSKIFGENERRSPKVQCITGRVPPDTRIASAVFSRY